MGSIEKTPASPATGQCQDANVEAVRSKLLDRSSKGIGEYGVSTERPDYSRLDWLRELQTELMDGAVYVEAALNACTCPSGDGSLRWPCPKHPPATPQPAAAQGGRAFQPGDRIEWQGMNGTWFPGKIVAVRDCVTTYDAKLDDGCDVKDFAAGRFRMLAAAPQPQEAPMQWTAEQKCQCGAFPGKTCPVNPCNLAKPVGTLVVRNAGDFDLVDLQDIADDLPCGEHRIYTTPLTPPAHGDGNWKLRWDGKSFVPAHGDGEAMARLDAVILSMINTAGTYWSGSIRQWANELNTIRPLLATARPAPEADARDGVRYRLIRDAVTGANAAALKMLEGDAPSSAEEMDARVDAALALPAQGREG